MSNLSERMEVALKSRKDRSRPGERINKAGLARACKIAASSVNDWFSGKTKSLGGESLVHAAAYLNVSANWLATGVGPMAPYTPGSSTNEPPDHVNTTGRKITHEQVKGGYADFPQYKGVAQVVANALVREDGFYAEERFEDGLGGSVPVTSAEASYALRIKGDSLSPAYKDGRILLVRPLATIKNGKDVVLVLKDGRSAILEFLFEQPDSLVFMPIKGGLRHTVARADIASLHLVYGALDADEWLPPEASASGHAAQLEQAPPQEERRTQRLPVSTERRQGESLGNPWRLTEQPSDKKDFNK